MFELEGNGASEIYLGYMSESDINRICGMCSLRVGGVYGLAVGANAFRH